MTRNNTDETPLGNKGSGRGEEVRSVWGKRGPAFGDSSQKKV